MLKCVQQVLGWVGVVGFMTWTGCFAQDGIRNITPKEAQGSLENGQIHLVDVREADELAVSGTAKGALWLPMSKQAEGSSEMKAFLEQVAPGGQKGKELVFFCRSGRRSGLAAVAFKKLGFRTANMGGFAGWVDAGLPTIPKP
jgi:rhodanese-related sulfurtransferase